MMLPVSYGGELARNMTTRITPLLRFHYDESLLRGHKMTKLIKKVVAEDNLRANKENADKNSVDEQDGE